MGAGGILLARSAYMYVFMYACMYVCKLNVYAWVFLNECFEVCSMGARGFLLACSGCVCTCM
jgi:hypothetical protein